MAPTPPWALYGATERGFDPIEARFFRRKAKNELGGAGDDEKQP